MFFRQLICFFSFIQISFSVSIQKDPICLLPKNEGLQQAAVGAVQRWYYNSQTSACEEFTFVPHGGNANNFQTQKQCSETCIEEKKCLFGLPLNDPSGRQLNCGMTPNRDTCPASSYCKVHPTDAYAVCCLACPRGLSVLDGNGAQILCTASKNVCPAGSYCEELSGICCKNIATKSNCPEGRPVTDSNGVEIFCGRGPTHQNCPSGTECVIDPADRFAVCCKQKEEKKCSVGKPLKVNNTEVFCGRGPTRQNCPDGYDCVIDPADKFAVCCRHQEEKKCATGLPLKRNNTEIFCGMGFPRQDCPKGYVCTVDPADRFAVCCKNGIKNN